MLLTFLTGDLITAALWDAGKGPEKEGTRDRRGPCATDSRGVNVLESEVGLV